MVNTFANKKGTNLSNSTGQLWSMHKSQVAKMPNSCFLAVAFPSPYPSCSAYSFVAEWKLMINSALPSNGIIKAEPWKLVSSYIQEEEKIKMCLS